MKIDSIKFTNYRHFKDLEISLDPKANYLVSENGGGKTSLLAGVVRALGKERFVAREDFQNPNLPIEITIKLSGFVPADQKLFPKELSFVGTPTLTIGFRAEWNHTENEPDVTCGFPDHGWRKASKEQRDALRVVWIPAVRDPSKLLDLGATRALWGPLFANLNLAPALSTASGDIKNALDKLASDPGLSSLLQQLVADLSKLIPDVDQSAFSLGHPGLESDRDLLRAFALLLTHQGGTVAIEKQSNGLIQLAILVFALKTLANDPRTLLLLDEPEISLHPQAQRSLAATIRALPNQSVVATHSSSVLDRVDLRQVVRIHSGASGAHVVRASTLTEKEATRLSRFVNPITAEACFARKVVLVEGYSDRVAILHTAYRLGRNLDGEGVSILAMDGGSGLGTYLRLFGAAGLGLSVVGLCDDDKVSKWMKELNAAGISVADKAAMESAGFIVCSRDLEEEFVHTLGLASVEAVVAAEGKTDLLANYKKQPVHAGQPADQVLRKFLHKDNTEWAVPLVDALDLKQLPKALHDLLSKV